MADKEAAASPRQGMTARKSISDGMMIHPAGDRRQFFQDSFGKFLTALIAAAAHAGRDSIVDDLLGFKSRWLKRGRQ
jgi:hypothetical protein